MRRFVAIATAVFLVMCGAAAAQAPAPARGFRWWRDAAVQQRLALTPAQIAELERTFQEKLEERRRLRQEGERADRGVAAALLRGDVSEAEALPLVRLAEDLRAKRNVTRTLMLLRLYRILTPAQRQALERVPAPAAGR